MFCFFQTYVQDMMMKFRSKVSKMILEDGGHVYICGDSNMAFCVYKKLIYIIKKSLKVTAEEAEDYLVKMKVIYFITNFFHLCLQIDLECNEKLFLFLFYFFSK